VQLLIERIGGGHLFQLAGELAVLPGGQAGLGQGPPDLRPQPLQPRRLGGQAGQSGHPGSPHYDDLLDDWLQGKSYEFGQPAGDALRLDPA